MFHNNMFISKWSHVWNILYSWSLTFVCIFWCQKLIYIIMKELNTSCFNRKPKEDMREEVYMERSAVNTKYTKWVGTLLIELSHGLHIYIREGGEKHRVVGGDVEREKKRNGPTNAGTCTSVVWAHRGADRKALPPKNIIIVLPPSTPWYIGVDSCLYYYVPPILWVKNWWHLIFI